MKKVLIKYYLTINVIAYIIVTFILWDITWIKDINNWHNFDRTMLIFYIIFINMVAAKATEK